MECFFLRRQLPVINSSIDRLGLDTGKSHPFSNPIKSVIDVLIKNRGNFASKLIASQRFFHIRHSMTEEGSEPLMTVNEFVVKHGPDNPKEILGFLRFSDTDAGVVMKPGSSCPKVHSGADSVCLRKVLTQAIINSAGGGNHTDSFKRIGRLFFIFSDLSR